MMMASLTMRGYYESLGGSGSRLFELDCLQTALLEQCSCNECGSGPIYRGAGGVP